MKDFKKYFIIPANPDEVYAALTNEATIMLWTGDKTSMKAEPGTEFSMWDDAIVGKILNLQPGKLIEQEWYFEDEKQQEPSIVTIKLHPHAKGTSLELKHSNIPDEAYDDITSGWTNVYMADLIDFYLDDEA
ncbi:MAG: SRPBCC domain-containing protein [Bacteroidia bacterium]|jgi:uncharacterized protein YndB with AHSA1/START domain|nr:SRPBCC domain-containing protein [Bacteroidia bacterium]